VHQDGARFLSQPVAARPGSPLRVAVYSRIAEAIRNGLLTPGSMIPTETELGADMKVSRTVVREALMLLEEDGLIRARRGVGRFVSEHAPPHRDRTHPPLRGSPRQPGPAVGGQAHPGGAPACLRIRRPGVGVEPGSDCWLWESVLIRDGEAIAHLQENVSAQPVSVGTSPAAPLEIKDDGGATLLASLNKQLGRLPGPGECQISLSQVGPSRAKLLDLRPSDPVLVLTQYVRNGNQPFYLAKCLVAARAGHLSVMQQFQS
jgi:GntR family transcriptional regulator